MPSAAPGWTEPTRFASADQATFSQRLTEPIAALDEQRAPERAALIAARLLGLALCRYILRFEPLAALSADEVGAAVARSVQRYLTR